MKTNPALCCCLLVLMVVSACGEEDPGKKWAGKLSNRGTSAAAIESLKQGGAESVPALISLIGYRDKKVWGPASMVIESLSPDPSYSSAIPLFYEALDSPKTRVRLWSAYALVKLGERDERIEKVAEAALDDESEAFQRDARHILKCLAEPDVTQ